MRPLIGQTIVFTNGKNRLTNQDRTSLVRDNFYLCASWGVNRSTYIIIRDFLLFTVEGVWRHVDFPLLLVHPSCVALHLDLASYMVKPFYRPPATGAQERFLKIWVAAIISNSSNSLLHNINVRSSSQLNAPFHWRHFVSPLSSWPVYTERFLLTIRSSASWDDSILQESLLKKIHFWQVPSKAIHIFLWRGAFVQEFRASFSFFLALVLSNFFCQVFFGQNCLRRTPFLLLPFHAL